MRAMPIQNEKGEDQGQITAPPVCPMGEWADGQAGIVVMWMMPRRIVVVAVF